MESTAHHNLKRLAISHLRQHRCIAVASEVQCPISRYRVDVAGYLEEREIGGPGSSRTLCKPRVIVIECKQSRSDFLRDMQQIEPLLAMRADYERIRVSMQEHRIKHLEPQLRQNGSSLFSELDDWSFDASRLPGYRKVLRQLRLIDEKLHGETKFFLMSKYQLADRLYLAAPHGMIRLRELPPGWGLLECDATRLEDFGDASTCNDQTVFSVSVEAPPNCTKPTHRMRLLRNIAVAACRHVR